MTSIHFCYRMTKAPRYSAFFSGSFAVATRTIEDDMIEVSIQFFMINVRYAV